MSRRNDTSWIEGVRKIMRFKEWIELFEMMRGDSKIKIEWETQSNTMRLGYFTIDNKIVYGIRRIEADKNKIGINRNVVCYDFGYFINGVLRFDLLKDSLYPSSVMNAIITEIKKEIRETDKIVICVAKRNNELISDYNKRINFYGSILELHTRRDNYTIKQFDNAEHERVWCMCKGSEKISTMTILKLCKKMDDSNWLDFANAKRVLKSLKQGPTK